MAKENGHKPLRFVESPEGIREIYSNVVAAQGTGHDLRIRFAQLIYRGNDSGVPTAQGVAEERAAVTVSWVQARSLRDLLSAFIERYEAANGAIKTDLTSAF